MTLEGVIYKADRTAYTGSFRLRMTDAPDDGEAGITVGNRLVVDCDGNSPAGQYSTQLRAGLYEVEIPGTPAFHITAPSGSGTYALEELTDAAVSQVTQQIFQSWTGVSAVTLRDIVNVLMVREDIDGQKAYFWRADGVVTGVEGQDYVKDAANTYFERGPS